MKDFSELTDTRAPTKRDRAAFRKHVLAAIDDVEVGVALEIYRETYNAVRSGELDLMGADDLDEWIAQLIAGLGLGFHPLAYGMTRDLVGKAIRAAWDDRAVDR